MTTPSQDDVIARAKQMTDALGQLSDDIGGLRHYGWVNRILVYLVGAVTVLQVGIMIWMGLLTNTAVHNSSLISRNRATLHAVCLASNESDAKQLQLWNFLFDLPHSALTDPAQAKRAQQVHDLITGSFVQKDCAKGP